MSSLTEMSLLIFLFQQSKWTKTLLNQYKKKQFVFIFHLLDDTWLFLVNYLIWRTTEIISWFQVSLSLMLSYHLFGSKFHYTIFAIVNCTDIKLTILCLLKFDFTLKFLPQTSVELCWVDCPTASEPAYPFDSSHSHSKLTFMFIKMKMLALNSRWNAENVEWNAGWKLWIKMNNEITWWKCWMKIYHAHNAMSHSTIHRSFRTRANFYLNICLSLQTESKVF